MPDIGWELALVLIVGMFVLAFLAVLVGAREARSKRMRVGFFVEREYFDQDEHVDGEEPDDAQGNA